MLYAEINFNCNHCRHENYTDCKQMLANLKETILDQHRNLMVSTGIVEFKFLN